jgi:broad specificity phosphatase PhoE
MPLPRHLVLVRHGESESNVVNGFGKQDNHEYFTPEFKERTTREWRLSARGVEESMAAGRWIGRYILASFPSLHDGFDWHVTSPYNRSKETAGHLGLPNAHWRIDSRVRERDWGDIESISDNDFQARYPDNARKKRVDPLHWRPPGGESIAGMVDDRIRGYFEDLEEMHKTWAVDSVCISGHGEYMWGVRLYIESMEHGDWAAARNDPRQKIHNGQVVHYTREDPESSSLSDVYSWMRSVNPVTDPDSPGEWSPVPEPRSFTASELLDQAKATPPLQIPGMQSLTT